VSQVKPHVVPSQVAVPCSGIVQAVQDVPQVLGLALGWQMPEQSCVSEAQTPAHDVAEAMQLPAHSFIPDGQVPPHIVPSQLAVPPIGIGQGTQAVPQLATSLFFTQIPTQLCVPVPQTLPASLPASLPPAPPRPRSAPASAARSAVASTVWPASFLFTGILRLRAVVQPAATIIIRRPAKRAATCTRMEVEIMALTH
jgi:hypothetical protein